MDVRDYEYIVAIAEQGSITRAAAQLFITQSALTKFLQRTEKYLGVPLFYRGGNRFQLTEAGRLYVEAGRSIVELDRKLMERLQEEMTSRKERLRLGYSMGRTWHLLGDILPAFYARYPQVHVIARGGTSRCHMQALERNELDLALVTNVERLPGFCYVPVDTSRAVLAVSRSSPLRDLAVETKETPYPMVKRKDLADIPMVILPNSTNSGLLARELLRRWNLQPNVVLEVSDIWTLIDAVARGYGSALIMSVPLHTEEVCYLSVEDTDLEQTVMLVYREEDASAPAIGYLTDVFRQWKAHSTP